MGHLYKITNKINGKVYIGTTFQNPPSRRWANHKTIANRNIRKTPLYNSMRKHGIENFEFEVIHSNVPEEQLHNMEYEMIRDLNLQDSGVGYNLADGGAYPKGFKIPEEMKLKLSVERTGEGNHFYGKKHTEEAKMLISKANTGKKRSEKHKQILRELNSGENSHLFGLKGELHPTFGRKRPEHEKAAIKEKHPLRKMLNMLDAETEQIIMTFHSRSDACRWLIENTSYGSEIRSMLSTLSYGIKKNRVVYGYKWEVVE